MEKFVHQLDCCDSNCANTRIGCIFNLGYTQCYNQQKSSLKKELHNSSLNTPTFISFINDSFGISSSNSGVSLAEIGVASLPSDYEYLSPPIPKFIFAQIQMLNLYFFLNRITINEISPLGKMRTLSSIHSLH